MGPIRTSRPLPKTHAQKRTEDGGTVRKPLCGTTSIHRDPYTVDPLFEYQVDCERCWRLLDQEKAAKAEKENATS
jgi:hypothetical protein